MTTPGELRTVDELERRGGWRTVGVSQSLSQTSTNFGLSTRTPQLLARRSLCTTRIRGARDHDRGTVTGQFARDDGQRRECVGN